MYNWWTWEGRSWRVLASYETRAEAIQRARHSADPVDTWVVARDGSQADTYLRENCSDRMAYRMAGR